MSAIINQLYDLQHHLTQVATAMRFIADETGNCKRHADELDGAAAMCQEWIEAIEDADHDCNRRC